MRVLSLCTGIGGIDLAAEATDAMEIVGQVEIDPFCNQVLAHHWPHVKRMRDLKEVQGDEWGAIELVVAGFPCQPASNAGKRRGAADARWLWPEVARIMRCAQPAFVLLENVPGLISLGLDDVLSDLATAGYEATAVVYPAAAIGAPHERERIFIVAYTNSGRSPRQQKLPNRRHEVQPGRRLQHDATGRSAALANTASTRLANRRRAGQRTHATQTGTGMESEPERCGAMEYASGTGCEERHPSRVACDAGHATGRCDTDRRNGQVELRLGIAAYGLPGRLAGHPGWPARPGEAQYEWEAPRTVSASDRTPGRAARLKALGNAVVPAQVLPILQAIAETWLANH